MRPTVEIAIPVYNEEAALEQSIRRLDDFCRESLPYWFRIVIADIASEDGTAAIGARLGGEPSRFALVGVASTLLYLLLFVDLTAATLVTLASRDSLTVDVGLLLIAVPCT